MKNWNDTKANEIVLIAAHGQKVPLELAQAARDEYEEALRVLLDLSKWSRDMGGWDSSVWQRVKLLCDKYQTERCGECGQVKP